MEKWRLVRDSFKQSGLKKTLLEVMLWNLPGNNKVSVAVDGEAVEVEVLAELPGAAFLQVPTSSRDASRWFRQVDKELSKRFPERIVRFQHASGDSWFWPKKLSSGSLSYERLVTKNNDIPDYLAQRLAGLSFTQRDHNTLGVINPISVREKIRGQFESSKVTSDFFKKFRAKHELLTSQIVGIEDRSEASSYSTLILNRLMFIYFLQKKEFLNGDPNYLKTCLSKVRELRGEDKFYSFYKDYLLELFFNKLDNPSGEIEDPAIHEIAGDIPYVNGGVFSRSPAEEKFEIEIPDSAFEEIFSFFDSYTWHLDTRPTGTANEINPEVIGYIFEQYINFTSKGKKEDGAYYTSHDVTGYMVSQSLVPRILDEVLGLGIDQTALLKENPEAYIFETLKHGWDPVLETWKSAEVELINCWESDPVNWDLLDAKDTDPELCLPDETWVEMFFRREKTDILRSDLRDQVSDISSLLVGNLNAQLLLEDSISQISEIKTLEKLWHRVSDLSVLDPTCGSGAFLFAALEILESVYAKILDRIEEVDPDCPLAKDGRSHSNRRYFLRKHAALRNLYGTDIMAEAIETAKLRVFLALASCLETKEQLEPLPDLDFNLKVGNLVVGFKDSDDVSRVANEKLLVFNAIDDLQPRLRAVEELQDQFIYNSENSKNSQNSLKDQIREQLESLRSDATLYYADCLDKQLGDVERWSNEIKPFHWIIEFPKVIRKGGFDVIVGNPPYISRKAFGSGVADVVGFRTKGFADFYEVCFERALQLLADTGRLSFIVMLSISFSKDFSEIRKIISERQSFEAWSTYAHRPDGLFTGPGVKNTIVTLGPGRAQTVATQHNVFTKQSRKWLFEGLDFYSIDRSGSASPLRGGIANGALTSIVSNVKPLGTGGDEISLSPTALYWFPVLPFVPPRLGKKSEIIEIRSAGAVNLELGHNEDKKVVVSALAGKLSFAIWHSTADNFHVAVKDARYVRSLLLDISADDELEALSQQLLKNIDQYLIQTLYSGKLLINARWLDAREYTDPIDRRILELSGLAGEWRSLNIWYRKVIPNGLETSGNSNPISGESHSRLRELDLV